MSRFKSIWQPGCVDHNRLSCECDLHVTLLCKHNEINWEDKFIITRKGQEGRRTVLQMNSLAIAYILTKFDMDDNGVIERTKIMTETTVSAREQLIKNCSHIDIKPRILGITENLTSTNRVAELPKWTYKLARLVDVIYEKMLFGNSFNRISKLWMQTSPLRKNQVSGIDENICYGHYDKVKKLYNPLTLRETLLLRISFYNTIACRWQKREQVAYSTDGLTEEKNMGLFEEFNVNNVERGPEFTLVQALVPKAFKLLEIMMDLKRYKNSETPFYDDKLIRQSLGKMNSSVGIVQCESGTTPYGIIKKTGKKFEHAHATMGYIHKWLVKTARGERVQFDCNCIVRYKGQFF